LTVPFQCNHRLAAGGVATTALTTVADKKKRHSMGGGDSHYGSQEVHTMDHKAVTNTSGELAEELRAQEMQFQICTYPTTAIHTAGVVQRHRMDVNTVQSI